MREKARIKRILSSFERIWEREPDMRFTQFLIALRLAKDSELWHMEDDKVEVILSDYEKKYILGAR